MVCLIHAYEQMYQGLHGMETYNIGVYKDIEDAAEDARDCSFEVMESYNQIMNDLEEMAEENETSIDEEMEDNVGYDIYRIKDEFIMSDSEMVSACIIMEAMEDMDMDEFIDYYCEK